LIYKSLIINPKKQKTMATNLMGTFDHETRVDASEKDLIKYGFLVNRGDTCNIEVMTFGGETAGWTLGPNEISPVKVRKLTDKSGMDGIISVLWNDDDQKAKPIDPSSSGKAVYSNVFHNGKPLPIK
jgi:hypothetical protein